MPLDTGSATSAVNALLGGNHIINPMGGFFAGQLMGQENQNNTINQQGALTANDMAAHQLEQSRLDDPLMAAKREYQTQDLTQRSATDKQFGQEQKNAAAQADISSKLTGMNKDAVMNLDNQLTTHLAAAQMIKGAGGVDAVMNDSDKQTEVRDLLKTGGIKNIPDQITPKYLQGILAHEPSAVMTKDMIQKSALLKQTGENQLAVQKVHGEYAVKAAEAAGDKQIEVEYAKMEPDKATEATITASIKKSGQVTPEQKATLVAIYKRQLDKDPAYKVQEEEVKREYQSNIGKDKKLVVADAEKEHIPGIEKNMTSEQIAGKIASVRLDRVQTALANNHFKAKFGNVEETGTTPAPANARETRKGATSPPTQGGSAAPKGSLEAQIADAKKRGWTDADIAARLKQAQGPAAATAAPPSAGPMPDENTPLGMP